jgi:hypothetical protein
MTVHTVLESSTTNLSEGAALQSAREVVAALDRYAEALTEYNPNPQAIVKAYQARLREVWVQALRIPGLYVYM